MYEGNLVVQSVTAVTIRRSPTPADGSERSFQTLAGSEFCWPAAIPWPCLLPVRRERQRGSDGEVREWRYQTMAQYRYDPYGNLLAMNGSLAAATFTGSPARRLIQLRAGLYLYRYNQPISRGG